VSIWDSSGGTRAAAAAQRDVSRPASHSDSTHPASHSDGTSVAMSANWQSTGEDEQFEHARNKGSKGSILGIQNR